MDVLPCKVVDPADAASGKDGSTSTKSRPHIRSGSADYFADTPPSLPECNSKTSEKELRLHSKALECLNVPGFVTSNTMHKRSISLCYQYTNGKAVQADAVNNVSAMLLSPAGDFHDPCYDSDVSHASSSLLDDAEKGLNIDLRKGSLRNLQGTNHDVPVMDTVVEGSASSGDEEKSEAGVDSGTQGGLHTPDDKEEDLNIARVMSELETELDNDGEGPMAPEYLPISSLVRKLVLSERDFLHDLLRLGHCVSEPLQSAIRRGTLKVNEAPAAALLVASAKFLKDSHRLFFRHTLDLQRRSKSTPGSSTDARMLSADLVNLLVWHGPALSVYREMASWMKSLRKLMSRCCFKVSEAASMALVSAPLRRLGAYAELGQSLHSLLSGTTERQLLEVWMCDVIEADDEAQRAFNEFRQAELLREIQSRLPEQVLDHERHRLIRYDQMTSDSDGTGRHVILFSDEVLICAGGETWQTLHRFDLRRTQIAQQSIQDNTYEEIGLRYHGDDVSLLAQSPINKLCFLHDLRQAIEKVIALESLSNNYECNP